MTYYPQTLPPTISKLVNFLEIKQPTFLDSFYLSGGTGLSLQIGHRESEDLDFFNEKPFNLLSLEAELSGLGLLENTELAPGTINTYINSVKLQFLEYGYPLLEPTTVWKGIKISSVLDIACTKLQTVSMRGSKKDFVDLFFLLELHSLPELLEKATQKYARVNYNQAHILKSLVYFEDAELQPMPRIIKDVKWDEMKAKIIAETKKIKF